MNYLTITERLLTWLDIERLLKEKTQLWSNLPEAVHWVDCYPDGMDIAHSCEQKLVLDWLFDVFGKTFNTEKMQISLRAGGGWYAVRLEQVPVLPAKKIGVYPLWRDIAYLQVSTQDKSNIKFPTAYTDGPKIISFHSFKGGVGRTTALMTYVAAHLQSSSSKPVKLLVVDADLEAPGVSFWLDDKNRPKVSFVQFLEALHYPPINIEASLKFFAEELHKTSLNVGGSHRELFILPAALDLTEIQDMPVQPSHLARNPSNPWVLTDYLHTLGRHLGVDAVFIDLRAGLSELSSPLIFDPRVEHYFVTTVAKQSVAGTVEVLKRLHTFNSSLPEQEQRIAKPSIVVSLLTSDLRKLPEFENAKVAIEQVYPPVGTLLDEGVEWLEADFSASLMSISSVREAFEKLKSSSLYINAQAWSSTLEQPLKIESEKQQDKTGNLTPKPDIEALYKICEKVQFAEKNESESLLITDPLRNLGKHFIATLPNAVLSGAKGAGKTFTFLQVCKARTWNKFLERVGEASSSSTLTSNAVIFPVIWSENLANNAKKMMFDIQLHCLKSIGNVTNATKQSEVLEKINTALLTPPDHWNNFWAELICNKFGVNGSDLNLLNQKFIQSGHSVVLVFDGIEDAFSNPPSNEHQQKAIESLLKLTNRLSELDDQRIGVLIFVRIDYIQAAIKQNLGQFLSRFTPFQLVWNPESFLRLAYWICAEAKIIQANKNTAEFLSVADLISALEKLWGRKLGSPNTKEALSARWVYSALCDLKGNFQARDLIRFFKFAAKLEKNRPGEPWPDRLLAPESIRRAIPTCSKEKVDEAIIEIAPLKAWSERMAKKKITDRRIPFSAESMELRPAELAALRELGVIYEDLDTSLGDERLFLPEIYRAGLGFDPSGGRPKIQALLKKNLGVMPF